MAFDDDQDDDTWGGSGGPSGSPSTYGGTPSYGVSGSGYGGPPPGSSPPTRSPGPQFGSYNSETYPSNGPTTPQLTSSSGSPSSTGFSFADDPHGVSGYAAATYPSSYGTYPSIDLYGGSITPSGVSIFPPVQVGWDNLARKAMESLQPTQPSNTSPQLSTLSAISPSGKYSIFRDAHSAKALYSPSTPSKSSTGGASPQSSALLPSLPYSTPDPKPNSVTLWTSPRGQVNKVWGQPNTPLYNDSVKYGSIRKRYVNTTTQRTTATYYNLPEYIGIVYDSAVNRGRQLGWIRLDDPKATLQPMQTLPASKQSPNQIGSSGPNKKSGLTESQKYAVKLNTPGVGMKWVDRPTDQFHAKGNMVQYANRKTWQPVDPHTLLPQITARVPVIGLPGYFYYYFKDKSKIIIGPNPGYSNHIIEPDSGKYAVFASIADVQNDNPIVGDPANIPPPARPVADRYSYMTVPGFASDILSSGVQGIHDYTKQATDRLPISNNAKQDITGAVTTVAGASAFVPQLITNAVSAASMDENADGNPATIKDRLKNVGQVFVDTGEGMISGPDMQHLIRGVSLLAGPDPDSDSTWQKEFGAFINDLASHPLTTATMIVLAKGDEGVLQVRVKTLEVAEGTYRAIARKAAVRGDSTGTAIALAKANKLAVAREWILDNAARHSRGALTLNPRTWIKQAKSLPSDVRAGLQRARATAGRVQSTLDYLSPSQAEIYSRSSGQPWSPKISLDQTYQEIAADMARNEVKSSKSSGVKPKSTNPPPSTKPKPKNPISNTPEAPEYTGASGVSDMWTNWGGYGPEVPWAPFSGGQWGFDSLARSRSSNGRVAPVPFDWRRDFFGESVGPNHNSVSNLTGSMDTNAPRVDEFDLDPESAESSPGNPPSKPSVRKAIQDTAKKVSKRLQYLGITPGKRSRTGRQVLQRMIEEGKVQADENNNLVIYHEPTDTWHPYELTDMGHIRDAVDWWNNVGVLFGPKSPQVREWMLHPDNYILEPRSINRSKGAKLRLTYNDPR